MEITLLSSDDLNLAPDDGAVTVIKVAADHGHFTGFRPGWGERTSDYPTYKNHLARALLDEAAGIVSGLRDAVLSMNMTTPLTFEKRDGKSKGAVAGWS
ncbi:MAG: hypothetical protein SWK76_17775 [Actinomycetota bacterium]|nr:hypothetical protein [Actinomycetota bacterium]